MLIKIKVGDIWKTRSGDNIEIERIVESDPMPVKHGKHLCWDKNGRYWDDEMESRMDLISLQG